MSSLNSRCFAFNCAKSSFLLLICLAFLQAASSLAISASSAALLASLPFFPGSLDVGRRTPPESLNELTLRQLDLLAYLLVGGKIL